MPKQRNFARRYLELKRRVWWFKIGIPQKAKRHFDGKSHYRVNLNTSDIRLAMERRDDAERDVVKLFKDIAGGKVIEAATLSARDRGMLWRDTLADVARADDGNEGELGQFSLYDIAQDLAAEEASKLASDDRQEFTAALSGKVPVDEHLEAYLKAIRLAEKTTNERRGLIKRFARWCEREAIKLPDVDRRTAGKYVTETIEEMHRRTAKKHMTALRGYWDYLTLRGHVNGTVMDGKAVDSPWLGQMLKDNKRRVERGDMDSMERPFTDDELRALLYAAYPDTMEREFREQIEDILRISCLSGLRKSEVITLWVEDIRDGLFDIKQGKTGSAPRHVPIHTDLDAIIARRTKGKGPKDWLFHELAEERDPSDTFGKRFKRYRMALGVNDARPDKRRSLVNFHSCRRWFIAQTEHAGIPETTVAVVVGHSGGRKGQTFGGYNKRGPSAEQRRVCVEAVSLPQPSSPVPQVVGSGQAPS